MLSSEVKKVFRKIHDNLLIWEPSVRNFIITFVSPVITITIFFTLRQSFLDSTFIFNPFSLMAIFIVIHTGFGGIWSGVTVTFLSSFIVNYLYIEPINSFGVGTPEGLSTVILYNISGLSISVFIGLYFTNRSHLQTALYKISSSTNTLRRVMDTVYTLVLVTDRDGKVIEVSQRYAQLLNLPVEDLKDKSILDIDPAVSSPQIKVELMKAIATARTNAPIIFYYDVVVGSNPMHIEFNVSLVPQPEFDNEEPINVPEVVVVAMRDLTDKKLYQASLATSQRVLNSLIGSNIIGMGIANLDGVLIDANNKLLEMLGYDSKDREAKNINWQTITPPEYYQQDVKKVAELKETGVMQIFEKEYYKKDGSRLSLMITGVMINDKEALCLMLDLTTQKNLQQDKDQFISIASHELKTPMTIIKGYLQILNKQVPKETSNFINTINNQLDKLNAILNELLDVSKIEANKLIIQPESVQIVELVEESIAQIKLLYPKRVFQLNIIKKVIAKIDKIRMEQVIINLLTNAVKYSKENKEVVIVINGNNTEFTIAVTDFGEGVPPESLELLFNRYYQINQRSPVKDGLGLGLYISQQIVAQHKGKISVLSEVGKGSTFIVQIPL